MTRVQLIIFFFAISSVIVSQPVSDHRNPDNGSQIPQHFNISIAEDFTITTTDGITRNLYNTLDSGKTVFIDLFYTTCSWCQIYAPIIEEIYQNTGAGEEDIEFWGISNNLFDTNWIIDQYKTDYNVSNPCAGPWGGGTTAFSVIVNGQNFLGFPTYCVVCPDRTLFFDPVYPPTVSGFDPYFEACGVPIGLAEDPSGADKTGILSVFPNPASSEVTMAFSVDGPGPVKIGLFNILGEEVYATSLDILPGIQSITLPVEDLPSGAYLIRLSQKNMTVDIKKALVYR